MLNKGESRLRAIKKKLSGKKCQVHKQLVEGFPFVPQISSFMWLQNAICVHMMNRITTMTQASTLALLCGPDSQYDTGVPYPT